MFGLKLKSWMETHLGKRKGKCEDNGVVVSPPDSRRESSRTEEESVSASASTSILLGSSFTQSLSSPDTGYSTDGYSPKNGYPALSTKSSSYALSSLLSMHLFKRSSPPIGATGEELPGVGLSTKILPHPQIPHSTTYTKKVEGRETATPDRKAKLAKEESTASPKAASIDNQWSGHEFPPPVKPRTRIKTNPWLSIPNKSRGTEAEGTKGLDAKGETPMNGRRSRSSEVSQGVPELNRISVSTDSGQGTLDNQHQRIYSSEYSSKMCAAVVKDPFVTGLPELRSTTSTATNTPISRARAGNGKYRASHSDPKSEDGTTLVDLMGGGFDESSSYQRMVDKETDILSDWANTDEDVDEDLLTPKGPATPERVYPPVLVDMSASPKSYAPSIPREINFNIPTNCFQPPTTTILPEAYDTLVLSGKSNLGLGPHSVSRTAFFPPPAYPNDIRNSKKKGGCYSSSTTTTSQSSRSKVARGALGLLRKLLFRKGSGRRDRVRETAVLPDCSFPTQVCSRLLPCSPAPSKLFLTPTPNSFRRKSEDSRPPSVQKGVDVIRLPSSDSSVLDPVSFTPVFPAKWQERPGQIPHSDMEYRSSPRFDVRHSPYLTHVPPKTPSPATFGLIRKEFSSGVPPIPERSPLLLQNTNPTRIPICDPAPRFSKTRLASPSFNNYSPIHRLVVTSHQVPRGNIRSEIPSVRSNRPPSSPLCVQHYASIAAPTGPSPIHRNPPYQYITSSNQSSPLLTNSKRCAPQPPPPPPHLYSPKTGPIPPLRGIIKPTPANNNSSHYYSTPQKMIPNGGCNGSKPNGNIIWMNGHGERGNGERIYERVDGLDNSDDGDGEGGDYECDLSLASSSQQSQSQSQSQERPVERERERKVHWPMSWGTALSETESRILEAEDADQKYRRLISQAEALLKEIAKESTVVAAVAHQQRKRSRILPEDCPQSDPLQRKTYDCWALRRLQSELASCCASPPVLHRSRVHLDPVPMVTHIPLVRNHSFLRAD